MHFMLFIIKYIKALQSINMWATLNQASLAQYTNWKIFLTFDVYTNYGTCVSRYILEVLSADILFQKILLIFWHHNWPGFNFSRHAKGIC